MAFKLHGASTILITIVVILAGSWYYVSDGISCLIENSGSVEVNGFYGALGGFYIKRGWAVQYNPDIFEAIELRKDFKTGATIQQVKNIWIINLQRMLMYTNGPDHPEDYLNNPPRYEWKQAGGLPPSPEVTNCIGSLQDSQPIQQTHSNLQELMNRPITTLLLTIICAIAYYLWTYGVAVAAVSYSYDAVVNHGEIWRMVSASFSHFEIFHLGFNAMTLYQLGILEPIYGSVSFASLSIALVFLTMIICTLCYHVMIYRYGRTEQLTAQGVGYSCVLFAWMVAMSVRMESFCPLFFWPSLCFTTWFIPLPLDLLSSSLPNLALPINIGPFVLLLITKVIIPRSSFVGHLSGILIGYPLAWGMLNWITPPMLSFLAVLTAFVLSYEACMAYKLPGFGAEVNLEEFVPTKELNKYKLLLLFVILMVIAVPAAVYSMGYLQFLYRSAAAFLAWNAWSARKCEWTTDSNTAHTRVAGIMMMSLLYTLCLTAYDAANLGAVIGASHLFIGCSLPVWYVYTHMYVIGGILAVELGFVSVLVWMMSEMPAGNKWLSYLSLDRQALSEDFRRLTSGIGGDNDDNTASAVVPFSGQAHRLDPGTRNTPTIALPPSNSTPLPRPGNVLGNGSNTNNESKTSGGRVLGGRVGNGLAKKETELTQGFSTAQFSPYAASNQVHAPPTNTIASSTTGVQRSGGSSRSRNTSPSASNASINTEKVIFL